MRGEERELLLKGFYSCMISIPNIMEAVMKMPLFGWNGNIQPQIKRLP